MIFMILELTTANNFITLEVNTRDQTLIIKTKSGIHAYWPKK